MSYHHSISLIALILIVIAIRQGKRRIGAAIINHRKNHNSKEIIKLKEIAQKFIGKECLIYTVTTDLGAEKGVITEITENGILLDNNGNLQAINLEYVTRIREYPRNAKGKKKVFLE